MCCWLAQNGRGVVFAQLCLEEEEGVSTVLGSVSIVKNRKCVGWPTWVCGLRPGASASSHFFPSFGPWHQSTIQVNLGLLPLFTAPLDVIVDDRPVPLFELLSKPEGLSQLCLPDNQTIRP